MCVAPPTTIVWFPENRLYSGCFYALMAASNTSHNGLIMLVKHAKTIMPSTKSENQNGRHPHRQSLINIYIDNFVMLASFIKFI